MKTRRDSIPKEIQLAVWKRDHWTCRYCGAPVFFAPLLKLLDGISPGHGYYHPNGKDGAMLPLFQKGWVSVDHIIPHAKGGQDIIENYVTACWGCNLKWLDKTFGQGKPQPKPITQDAKVLGWDGLSSLYLVLPGIKDADWVRLLRS